MKTITIGLVALAIAGGILMIRNRRRPQSLDETLPDDVAKMNGASTLASQAEPTQATETTQSKSAQSAEAAQSASQASTETDGKGD